MKCEVMKLKEAMVIGDDVPGRDLGRSDLTVRVRL